MKKFLFVFVGVFFAVTSFAAPVKTKALSSVCTSVQGYSSLFVYKNSAPLRSGGVGTPLIGYREEPTLIMTRNVSSRGTSTIYDSNGKSLGRCPWTSAHGFSGGRFRCTMNTRALRRAAIKNTRSPSVYFTLKGKSCVKIADAGKCYGSSKGKCNQTLG